MRKNVLNLIGPARALLLAAALAAAGSPVAEALAQSAPEAGELADGIRHRLEAGSAVGRVTAAGVALRSPATIDEIYVARLYQPAWLAGEGQRIDELTDALLAATGDGLSLDDYRFLTLVDLRRALAADADLVTRVDLELLLTDAFVWLATHLSLGRLDPATHHPRTTADGALIGAPQLLERAVSAEGVEAVLDGLRPPTAGYGRLVEALAAYREISMEGGWSGIPEGETLEIGSGGGRVAALTERLAVTRDLDTPDRFAAPFELPPLEAGAGLADPAGGAGGMGPEPPLYDSALARAVQRFQRRHGLEADGRVGRATLRALNVPVARRIEQIELNLERLRWLPDTLGSRYVWVNVPSYTIDVMEHEQAVMSVRGIVGRPDRETPIFSARITYLVLSPYWNVPPRIAVVDKLPLIRRDPAYLARTRMTLLDLATNRPVDPATVDWTSITGAEFNRDFRLRQDPGPWNALGAVKFVFPNPYSVFLHDTDEKQLFERTTRCFSSGCLRMEDALAFAHYLLRSDPEWTFERIMAIVDERIERMVPLREPIPIHIQYLTAWVDDADRVFFLPDVYARDGAVRRGLTAMLTRR